MKLNRTKTPYFIALQDRILETAMQAFTQQGIKAVKMDDIAKFLGISKRTLYEIYDNKEVLLFEGVKRFRSMSEERLSNIYENASDVIDILLNIYRLKVEESKKICPEFYSDLEKYPTVQNFLKEGKQQSLDNFVMFLQRGVDEGYFRKDMNLQLVSSSFTSSMENIMHDGLYKTYSIEELFHNVVFVSFRGFCTLEGIKRLDQY